MIRPTFSIRVQISPFRYSKRMNSTIRPWSKSMRNTWKSAVRWTTKTSTRPTTLSPKRKLPIFYPIVNGKNCKRKMPRWWALSKGFLRSPKYIVKISCSNRNERKIPNYRKSIKISLGLSIKFLLILPLNRLLKALMWISCTNLSLLRNSKRKWCNGLYKEQLSSTKQSSQKWKESSMNIWMN